jgi:hypothetical protein
LGLPAFSGYFDSGLAADFSQMRGARSLKVPVCYSAVLTRAAPGGFAIFQSPGARTLLVDRISIPNDMPSASTL